MTPNLSELTQIAHELELTMRQDAEYMIKLSDMITDFTNELTGAILSAEERATLDTDIDIIEGYFGNVTEDIITINVHADRIFNGLVKINVEMHPEEWEESDNIVGGHEED